MAQRGHKPRQLQRFQESNLQTTGLYFQIKPSPSTSLHRTASNSYRLIWQLKSCKYTQPSILISCFKQVYESFWEENNNMAWVQSCNVQGLNSYRWSFRSEILPCKVTTNIMKRHDVNCMECSGLSNRNSDLLKLTEWIWESMALPLP